MPRIVTVRAASALPGLCLAVPNGRTTPMFINLRDNSASHDKELCVPFARVVEGMDVADPPPLFEGGNVYLARNSPRLEYISKATVVQ